MDRLADYIRVYDHSLGADFCARLVAGFEQSVERQFRNGRGVHEALDKSAWTEVDVGRFADEAFLGFFLARMDAALASYNADVPLTIPVPTRPRTDRLILKRYRPGGEEAFQPHFDSIDAVSGRHADWAPRLVAMWVRPEYA